MGEEPRFHEGPPLGKEDWAAAARIAAACGTFSPDDDDEQIAEEAQSCYNCRYRRWTATSFYCCKRGDNDRPGNKVTDLSIHGVC